MAGTPETVYLLIGIDRDPMPEEPKRTRYWVAAGPCPACSHTERRLVRGDSELVLQCARCDAQASVGLSARSLAETSYVFWCGSPHFECDDAPLTRQERDEIERLLAQFGEEAEPVHFGVVIEAGLCRRTKDCINTECLYNHRSLPGRAD